MTVIRKVRIEGGQEISVPMPDGSTDEELLAKVEEMHSKGQFEFGGRDMFRMAFQGASFGFSDEILSGIESAFTDETYKGALKENRALVEQSYEKDFAKAMASEIAGGFATGGVGGAKTLGGMGLRHALPQMAKLGAGFGATAGAGYSTDSLMDKPMEVFSDAIVGAGIGATGGVALGGGAAGVGQLGKMVGRYLGSGRNKRSAENQIRKALLASGKSNEEVTEILASNPAMILADVAPQTQGLAAEYATPQMVKNLEGRTKEQADRLMPKIQKALEAESDDYFKALNAVEKTVGEKVDPLYAAAYSQRNKMSDEGEAWLAKFLKTKKGAKAQREAEELRAWDELNEMDFRYTDPASGESTTYAGRWSDLDYLQEALSDMGRTTKMLKSRKGKKIRDSHKKLVGYMEESNAPLAEARTLWRGRRAGERAADMGRNIFGKKGLDFINSGEYAKLPSAEQSHFKIGVMKAIKDLLGTKKNSSELASTLENTPKFREALRKISSDPKEFDKLMRAITQETDMWRTGAIVKRTAESIPVEGTHPIAALVRSLVVDTVMNPEGGQRLATHTAGRNVVREMFDPHGGAQTKQFMSDMLQQNQLPKGVMNQPSFVTPMGAGSSATAGAAPGLLNSPTTNPLIAIDPNQGLL